MKEEINFLLFVHSYQNVHKNKINIYHNTVKQTTMYLSVVFLWLSVVYHTTTRSNGSKQQINNRERVLITIVCLHLYLIYVFIINAEYIIYNYQLKMCRLQNCMHDDVNDVATTEEKCNHHHNNVTMCCKWIKNKSWMEPVVTHNKLILYY